MFFRRKKLWIIIVVAGLLAVPLVLVLAHPRARSVLRLTSGFVRLEKDPRVFYEPGGEKFAERFAEALPGAVARVVECQALPFASEFRVYVCASHESFTQHLSEPADSLVRGVAFLWDIWVSPKAFSFYGRDTHRQTLAHELSHLHLDQHLGWFRRTKNVPAWFMEGLADWVADTGTERVSRGEALEAFLTGNHLVPDASGHLPLTKRPRDYGMTWPMFHAQSRMFIEYLHAKYGESFKEFVAAVVGGVRFDVAFQKHLGGSLDKVWNNFLDSLKT